MKKVAKEVIDFASFLTIYRGGIIINWKVKEESEDREKQE